MKKIVLIALTTLLGACSTLSDKTISGTFKGTLPCADCQKIEAELILNADKTYQYRTVFFKRKEQHPFIEKGVYVWDQNKPNTIRLHSAKEDHNSALPDILLKISDTGVEMCDENGKVPYGNNYKLSKVAP